MLYLGKPGWCNLKSECSYTVWRWGYEGNVDFGFDEHCAWVDFVLSMLLYFNTLTAAIRGSGYKLYVKWRRYPGARLERYLQNGVVIRRPG